MRVLFFFLLLAHLAFGDVKVFTQTVKQSFGGSQSADDALVSAIAKAKRAAVEQAGTYIQSVTELSNGTMASDNVLAMAGGISKTEVLSQKNYIEGNIFGVEVTVRCAVNTDNLKEKVEAVLKDKTHLKELEDSKQREAKLLEKVAELEEQNKQIAQMNESQKQELKQQFQQTRDGLSAEDYFNKANTLWDSQKRKYSDPTLVIAWLTKALTLDPNSAGTYNNRGAAYADLQHLNEAIQDYTQAIALDPNDAIAYYNRGNVYADLQRLNESIQDYTKALTLDPNYTGAYTNRGVAYADLQRFSEAIQDYTHAIALDPNLAQAYFNRGQAYTKLYRFNEAIQDYTQAVTLDPNLAQAYYNRGAAYANLQRFNEAIQNFTQAIALNPNDAGTYYNRGYAYFLKNMKSKGLKDAKKACSLGNCALLDFLHSNGIK